jgi:hypothetical protein
MRQNSLRQSDYLAGKINFSGIKTTPATSDAPAAFQPNQWGVDVVETKSMFVNICNKYEMKWIRAYGML